MNVIKVVSFTGRLLDQVRHATDFVRTQIREYTKLGEDAVFQTITGSYPANVPKRCSMFRQILKEMEKWTGIHI